MSVGVSVGFSDTSYTVMEDMQTVTLTLMKSGQTEFDVTVQFTTSALNATIGQYYVYVCLV